MSRTKKVTPKPNTNGVHIVNLANYVQPEIKEEYGKDYVTYGKKNSYFQYLIDRSNGSATNGAVVQSIIDLIYGEGLGIQDVEGESAELDRLNDILPANEVKKAVNDIKRMGQCALQVQYFGGRKSAKIKHVPVERLAAEKISGNDTEIQAYYYATDWNKVQSPKDLTRIPAFGTSKEGLEILYIKPYNSEAFLWY